MKRKIDLTKIPDSDLDSLIAEAEVLSRNSISRWKPHPKQLLFHTSNKSTRLMLGGNRSGKTEAGAAEAIMHATGEYPKWFPEENKLPIPNKGRIIVSDFSKGFGENLQPKIEKWLPADKIKFIKKNHEGHPSKYVLKNGSTFDICTHEQEAMIFEGWSGHWAWFDEPPPRSIYISTARGLVDFGGKCWLTLTPISQPWIWDELVHSSDQDVFVVQVNMRDNIYLTEAFIKRFEKKLTPEEKEARIHGKFLHLSGLVYKQFDRAVHVKSLHLEDPESPFSKMQKKWFFVLDPHDRRPHCGLWAFMNPQNKIFIAYELWMEGTITQLSAQILGFEKIKKIPSYEVMRIGDPNKMETPSAVSGLKLKMEFLNRDDRLHFFTKVDDDIARGHLAVKEGLSYNADRPLDTLNSPRLMFNERKVIPNVLDHFEKYGYQDWKGGAKDSRNPRETPKDVYKDFPDCVRYLMMFGPEYNSYASNDFTPSITGSGSRTGYIS